MSDLATNHEALATDRPSRRLRPGVGLALGAATSLSMWAVLAHIVLRLIG